MQYVLSLANYTTVPVSFLLRRLGSGKLWCCDEWEKWSRRLINCQNIWIRTTLTLKDGWKLLTYTVRVTSMSSFLSVALLEAEQSVNDRYEPALKSLQHALLLAPQNPFYVLQAAEVAYTAGDVPLAARFYLMVIDMTEDPDLDPASRVEAVPEGIAVRAWFGLKQVWHSILPSLQYF